MYMYMHIQTHVVDYTCMYSEYTVHSKYAIHVHVLAYECHILYNYIVQTSCCQGFETAPVANLPAKFASS